MGKVDYLIDQYATGSDIVASVSSDLGSQYRVPCGIERYISYTADHYNLYAGQEESRDDVDKRILEQRIQNGQSHSLCATL